MADQDERDRQQLEQVGLAMGDKAIAWAMFEYINKRMDCEARAIVTKVMTYEPPKAAHYMELGDADLF